MLRLNLRKLLYYPILALYKFWYPFRNLLYPKQPHVLVYQMGKVGSSTIYQSLRQSRLKAKVYHLHYLTDQNIQRYETKLAENYLRTGSLGKHLIESRYVYNLLHQNKRFSKFKIVTLVRDPIATCISGYVFRKETNYQPGSVSSIPLDEEKLMGELVEEVRNYFLKAENHEWILNWFDQELGRVFGVDIYQYPFSHNTGYLILDDISPQTLILRCEDLEEKGREGLQKFFNLDSIQLSIQNTSREKNYHKIYTRVLKRLKLPISLVDSIYESRFTRHFYTPSEVGAFKSRWCEKN